MDSYPRPAAAEGRGLVECGNFLFQPNDALHEVLGALGEDGSRVEDRSTGGLALLPALAKRRRCRYAVSESRWRAPADSERDAKRARRRVGQDAVSIPRHCGLRGLDGTSAGHGGPTVAYG